MNFSEFSKKIIQFSINRIIDMGGILIICISLFLLLSLITYSPEDPNFIFPENTNIKNIFGFYGSFTSDIFFQSLGLISFLLSLTILGLGINIIKNKKIINILKTFLYCIFYIIFGCAFLNIFYNESYWLIVSGNGGFVGNFSSNIINNISSNIHENIIYIFLIIITATFFFLSLNLKISTIYNFFINIIIKIFKKKEKVKYQEEINFSAQTPEVDKYEKEKENKQTNFSFQEKEVNKSKKKFIFPSLEYLKFPNIKKNIAEKNNNKNSDPEFLEKILLDFGVEGKIKKISNGPVVTLNEFEPAPGIKVSKIINLSEDIARNTSSESARIATIPGKNTVGIEIPNLSRENVFLSEIISDEKFSKKDIKLPIALGKSISGTPLIGDLTSMPHLLIAGTTGSGKSVCINTIILSIIYKLSPEQCKFIMIDPKMLELSTYEGIPHLICPVITEAKKAASVLGWVVKEMESRYKLMTKEGVRNIDGYNSKHKLVMPYIVVVVDEMSDLMLVAGKEIENYIQKLSQMARAAGIHIIMATQRPSVDVITGTIKANFPTRISFQVTSKIDSRTILGEQGAEQLLGKGDMLFMSSANRIVRIHAPYVSENEIEKINSFLRSQAEPDYVDEILNFADEKETGENYSDNENKDQLYQSAVELVKTDGKASTSYLQRKLQIGYNRAARIIDMMEEDGIVSKANHVGKREVL
ncbi:MAG: DNA translocase FtsK [Pelagibacteraceae bacterium TMED233]|nr:MAG: DNA translocase FtsK [Pelagibacteraceae bacterium TMED233]